jgi:uncharacterized protein YrrD
MKFNFGTDILNHKGEKVAELEQVVIDPSKDEVTSLIAKKGFLFTEDKVIPISLVMGSTDEYIKLYNFEGSFDDLDDYIEVHYVKADKGGKYGLHKKDEDNLPPLIAYPPMGNMGVGFVPSIYYPEQTVPKKIKNTAGNTVDISRNARVIGLSGDHIGDVEEVIVNPNSDRITHFVISKGLVFNEEKLIPSSWVRGFDSNQLKLVVNSKIVEQLPEYER